MNFLQLCQRVRESTGISDMGPDLVTNQTGKFGRIVSFVRQADLDIQNEQTDWLFLWTQSQGATTANRADYLPGDFGMSQVDSLTFNQLDSLKVGGRPVALLEWRDYQARLRDMRLTARSDAPQIATVKPDGKITLYPTPGAALPVEVDYYKDPQPLTNNTDVSAIPAKYHEAIVQKALVYFAQFEQDQEIYETALALYNSLSGQLAFDQLPAPVVEPLGFGV